MKGWVAGLAVLALVLAPSTGALAQSWYVDVAAGHWARPEIYALFRAGVADGWFVPAPGLPVSLGSWYYKPDQAMARGEVVVLLLKAMGIPPGDGPIPFVDVPPSFEVYGRFPLRPYVASAVAKDLLSGEDGLYFNPRADLQRQYAAAWLIRSLGLKAFAQSLSPLQIQQQLRRFRDGGDVAPRYQAEVAAAILLGIIRGYPDGTLRPRQTLTRAEATVMVFRSAWIQLEVYPSRWDPALGPARIRLRSLENGNVRFWQAWIEDDRGAILRTFTWYPPQKPPLEGLLPSLPGPGLYWVKGSITSVEAPLREAIPIPLLVEGTWMTGQIQPPRVPAGQPFRLLAQTSHQGQAVTATLPWGLFELLPLPALPEGKSWSLGLTVPADLAPGTYPIRLEGLFFESQRRSLTLFLEVLAVEADEELDLRVVLVGSRN
ncbi:MAG: S-layer homology domain-containing protein [Bacillota bacterium]|nr:S-layer homology domain-containing protein [Bacillota bacterium]